ncbi:N-glycosylation protein EOS1 [Cordyceps fumosorosea ARSEF 2679]|uniref:N-glycosylation protein EOS1 n=1 Tax=Cordyceps fumosorosea (strain ARSEF 2679) TaxID=1081104 RepID=A0A167T1B8_CORFA|nr:N-glycosylation protein EOS1 [Cordyceps fumosorosea ARSEF 2679]OAA60145.1 N-glycosylation protein EOS1 [Cordyceps fumosorosea ARSEF 2679]
MVAGGQSLHRASPSPSPSLAASSPSPAATPATLAATATTKARTASEHGTAGGGGGSGGTRTAAAHGGGPTAAVPRSSRFYTSTPSTTKSSGRGGASTAAQASPAPSVHPSMLQPRVAVVLNVPPRWHPWLFALRLLSCLPAAWWGLPSALHLLLRVVPGPEHEALASLYRGDAWSEPYALTETALATIWCFSCGYLSFFFTDCLMSRWLINYTPQATIVRLLTIDVINAYLTLTTLSLAGGFQDPRLLLPGWIGIATTLTVCYHISHQRINIRKETSTSVNVFSIASYLSMVALLAHMLAFQPDYPAMPVVVHARRLWHDALHYVAQIKGTIERERAEL